MGERIKLHLFSFSDEIKNNPHDLHTLFEKIRLKAIADRVRIYNSADYRVETIKRDGDVWYMDFAKHRYTNGPGKASKTTLTTGFDFDDGEFFSEETACMINVAKKYIIIQYNQNGTRAGAMQYYINNFDPDMRFQLAFKPKYDDEALARFEQRSENFTIEMLVDKREFNAQDRRGNTSLANALKAADSVGSPRLFLKLLTGKHSKNPLKKRESNGLINKLKQIMARNPDAVENFKVGYKVSLDEAITVFDLVIERISKTFNDLPKGADNRIPLEARFHAIERINKNWEKLFK